MGSWLLPIVGSESTGLVRIIRLEIENMMETLRNLCICLTELCRRKVTRILFQRQNRMVIWKETGMVAVVLIVARLHALREHGVHSCLKTSLCRMAVRLQMTSIKVPVSLQDQRLQREGKRVSNTSFLIESGDPAVVRGAVNW